MYKIDKADESLVAGYTWHYRKGPNTSYLGTWIKGTKNPRQLLLMHNLINGRAPGDLVTDHIDRDGTNNQRSNLRHVTKAINRANSKLNADNKTGYRGVTIFRGRFRADCSHDGKTGYLGLFDTPQEAHQVYLNEFNRINGGAYARD